MTTDREKLRVLLPHWIEHNGEHAAEFLQWADKALAEGDQQVAEELALAAKQMGWVNEALKVAVEQLGEVAVEEVS
jgi:Flp pilus assembly protein TadD